MNTAQSIFEIERQRRLESLRLLVCHPELLIRHPEPACAGRRSEGPASSFGELPEHIAARQSRLARRQFRNRFRDFLARNQSELVAVGIFFTLIGAATFMLTALLHSLDRIAQLEETIRVLRSMAN